MSTRRFRYASDGLFLLAVAAYAANRWVIKPHVRVEFWHGHFNDLLLIPALLPLVLAVHRRLGWRDDRPPTAREVAGHVVVWSMVCEWLAPRWLPHGTADWRDAAAYAAGGLVAWAWWNRPVRQTENLTKS